MISGWWSTAAGLHPTAVPVNMDTEDKGSPGFCSTNDVAKMPSVDIVTTLDDAVYTPSR